MDYRTIVKNEDWKDFAKELFDKTSLRFEDADELIDFDPFDCGAYWHYCGIDMDEDAGVLSLSNNIDDQVELLSNDEFIERCSVYFPKNVVATKEIKEKLGSGCFVVEDEWEKFSELLEKFTSIKWLAGQKPKDYTPFDKDSYVFISLGEKDGAVVYGLCLTYPEAGVNYLTQTDFIHMCSKLFPKD